MAKDDKDEHRSSAEQQQQSTHDDGGAAAEDAAAMAGITELEGGAVDITLDGELAELARGHTERSARHAEGEHEDVATHDATGRALSVEERDQLRASRRDEKRRRRDAARDREDRLRLLVDTQNRTISELVQRIGTIEQRGTTGELQNLDGSIRQAQDAAQFFKERMAEAIQANNGAVAADFSGKMTQAAMRAEQLVNVRQTYLSRQTQPAPLDPRHQAMANKWMADNRWYNPQNTFDPDTRIALAIDDGLYKEGFQPTDPRYWEELTKRMKKYLPHRYARTGEGEDADGDGDGDENEEDRRGDSERRNGANGRQSQQTQQEEQQPERKPVRRIPNAGGGEAAGGTGTFRLSAERVEAMKQAGYWSDPKKRASMVKRYMEEDRATRQAVAARRR